RTGWADRFERCDPHGPGAPRVGSARSSTRPDPAGDGLRLQRSPRPPSATSSRQLRTRPSDRHSGSEPAAPPGRLEGAEPFFPFFGNERVLPCQEELEEGKIIVSPEELVSHLHGRDTKDSTGNRLVRLLTKAILDLGCLRLCDEHRSRQAYLAQHALDDRRLAEMESPNPGRPEERVDQIAALRFFERK